MTVLITTATLATLAVAYIAGGYALRAWVDWLDGVTALDSWIPLREDIAATERGLPDLKATYFPTPERDC